MTFFNRYLGISFILASGDGVIGLMLVNKKFLTVVFRLSPYTPLSRFLIVI